MTGAPRHPVGSSGRPSAAVRPRLVTPAFLAIAVAALAFFTAGGIVLPVATRYAHGPLGADVTGVGLSIGVFSVAALAFRPVVGWAADRFGRRPLLLLGGGITVVALAAHLAATTLPAFFVVRSLLGIGEAFFFVAAVAAIADIAPPSRRGEAINLGSLSVYLGLALGPFIGETVLAASGYDAVWVTAAAMAVVATALSVFVRESAPGVLAAGDRPRPRGRLFHPAGILPGFLVLTGAWGMAGYFAFVALLASGVGMPSAGLPLAMYAAIVIALRIVFASLPDRMGPARLAGAALAVTAVGLAVIAVVPGQTGLLAGTAVFAVGIAFMFPALIALAVSRVDETERGSVVGTTSAFLDLSFGLGPAVLGVVVDASGFPAAFLLSAAIAALGAGVIAVRHRSLVRVAAVG
jgi:MFS family permease